MVYLSLSKECKCLACCPCLSYTRGGVVFDGFGCNACYGSGVGGRGFGSGGSGGSGIGGVVVMVLMIVWY